MDDKEKLFTGFPPVTVAEWEAKIKADLKGADYSKKLIGRTLENISIKPYYTSADLQNLTYHDLAPGTFPYVRGNKTTDNHWQIRQDFVVTDIETAVEKAKIALEHGVMSVGFDLRKKGDLYYHDFRKLITGIDFSKTEVHFIVGEAVAQMVDHLTKALEELKIDRTEFKGSIEYDPLGHLVVSGGFFHSERHDFEQANEQLAKVLHSLPNVRLICVNSYVFSDAGASVAQELAFGLSMIADYMVQLSGLYHNPSDIANHLQWNMGVGSDYFLEIARIRAARVLFSALMSAFDAKAAKAIPVYIHSITVAWNKTLYDPNVNMLRLTTEAMAAVLGGCNSLLVRPFDSAYNQSDDFSERMARNVQIILKEESYFSKVIDPAAGAYYIESLTDSLVDAAWELFLKIDGQGGFIKSFASGFIGNEVKATSDRRKEMVAHRREILLGTNQYPNINETVNGCIDESVAFPKPEINSSKIAEPINLERAAAEFEKLRLSTEQHKGKRPKVFMLTYGNLAMRLARSQFSGNFFSCGGYEIVDNLGFQSAKEGVDAAFEAKADIIVVCSSDDEYLQIAPEVAELVKDKALVVVAGAPASMEELKQKGISTFIHIRSNVLETLKQFHVKLGIKQNN